LKNTILATADGACVIDPVLLQRKLAFDLSPLGSLTKKQKQVLEGIARGLSNKQLAEEMDLSITSIETHLTGIYNALELPDHANNRVAAVLRYLELHPNEE
jgi:DNA-binding NarL/FixJ family response regulator